MTHLHSLTAVALALLLASSCCAELVNSRPPPLHKCNVSGPAKQPDPLVSSEYSTLSSSPQSMANSMPSIAPQAILSDDDLDACQETYIIEPQSGDIYVMATPSSPLRRFPYSVPELVDMSPFSFATGDDHRVFVGKKTTSEVVVELETGNIKATIDWACPWDLFENLREDDEVDLDELEGSKPPMSKPTEVFIGRTDYHITIHTRPSSKHRIPVQNLSFSTYGPNNQDNILQGSYRNTKDDAYIQSLPNGEIISFKAREESSGTEDHSILWGSNSTTRSPSAALRHPPQTRARHLEGPAPPLESAYIGLVEETGSLFAMSADRFPLVAFAGRRKRRRTQ
ncbi:hypothetical protein B0H14DRAFT_3771156 [Mycena olivaceomarginata]|nr:hypothetical protein B0H14DRAFT_3771156 [Mycena olivaceomarginata]